MFLCNITLGMHRRHVSITHKFDITISQMSVFTCWTIAQQCAVQISFWIIQFRQNDRNKSLGIYYMDRRYRLSVSIWNMSLSNRACHILQPSTVSVYWSSHFCCLLKSEGQTEHWIFSKVWHSRFATIQVRMWVAPDISYYSWPIRNNCKNFLLL